MDMSKVDEATNDSGYGLGPNAMRVFMLDSQATLRNLTVADGRASNDNTEDDNNHGAGVLARDETAKVVDCILTNNIAYRASGGRYGTYIRCKFLGNRCIRNGSAGRDGRYYGCFFDGNRGGSVLNYPNEVSGCTFGENSQNFLLETVSGTRVVKNTFFVGKKILSNGKLDLFNCVIPSEEGVFGTATTNTFENCVWASGDALSLAADGRPIIGCTAGIDCGDVAAWNAIADLAGADAAGGQRVYNGAMDIGCYEADWRDEYAKVLAKRATVTAASAGVTLVTDEEGTKTVSIPAGDELTAAFTVSNPSATWKIAAAVTGGTLDIAVNDETKATVTAASASPIKIANLVENEQVFHFTHATEGMALLGGMSQDLGLTFILR